MARLKDDQIEQLSFQEPGLRSGDICAVRLLRMVGPQAWVQGTDTKPYLCDVPQKMNGGQTIIVRLKTPPISPKPGRCAFERLATADEPTGTIIHKAQEPLDIFLKDYPDDVWITNDESLFDRHPNAKLQSTLNSQSFIDQWIKPLLTSPLPLPEGGSALIEVGETLTAIDINTSSAVNSGYDGFLGPDMENLFAFNKRILPTLAKAIELFKLGGIVLIDLPRMNKPEEREFLKKQMRQLTRSTGIQVLGFTKAGLLELLIPRREMDLFKRFS